MIEFIELSSNKIKVIKRRTEVFDRPHEAQWQWRSCNEDRWGLAPAAGSR